MAANDFAEHCAELLAAAGRVRRRRMFGGHGLYVDELFVALIIDERLYLKTDPATRPRFEAAGCEPFVYQGRGRAVETSYWSAPDETMDSPALMAPWVRLAVQAALAKRAQAPARARTTAPKAMQATKAVRPPGSPAAAAAPQKRRRPSPR